MRPCGVQGEEGDFDAALLEGLGGVEDGVVLDGGGDEVGGFWAARWLRTPKRARLSLSVPPEVKTISEARQWSRRAMELAGVVDGGAGVLALLMDGAGVAEVLDPEGTHGLEDLGEERGGGVGVHVDAAHGSILLRWGLWAPASSVMSHRPDSA